LHTYAKFKTMKYLFQGKIKNKETEETLIKIEALSLSSFEEQLSKFVKFLEKNYDDTKEVE
jgi:hypothetical protein